MIDHDARCLELIASVFAGRPAGLTRDDILRQRHPLLAHRHRASAAQLYWENARIVYKGEVSLPAAFTVFPDEIIRTSRSWVESTFTNLIYFNEVDKGGHFAAWEEPEALLHLAPSGVPKAPGRGSDELTSGPN